MKNKKKQTLKSASRDAGLLFFVGMLYNYSVVSIAVAVIVIIFFFLKGVSIFEGATLGNIISIVLGLLIYFPVRNLRKKLRGD